MHNLLLQAGFKDNVGYPISDSRDPIFFNSRDPMMIFNSRDPNRVALKKPASSEDNEF